MYCERNTILYRNFDSIVKINRNEECPCQSGKKYKKCCLHTPFNEEILRALSLTKTIEELKAELQKPMMIFKFKISLSLHDGEISRILELTGDKTLYDFHMAIQSSFNWDNDHLFSFYMDNTLYSHKKEYSGNPLGERIVSNIFTKKQAREALKVQIRDLELGVKSNFIYLFDYGTEIIHQIIVIDIRKKLSGDHDIKEISRIGNSVNQYEL